MVLATRTIQAKGTRLETRAALPPDTWNSKAGTFEAIFATAGARTKRYRPEVGDFWEELGLEPHEIDLRRLKSSGPVLNAHGRQVYAAHSTPGLEDQIATVLDAWTTSLDARAQVRLIDRPDLKWIRDGVANGDFAKLSAGYRVNTYRWIGDADDGLPIYRAVSWVPYEISLLPIAEDVGALVRSASTIHTETFEIQTPTMKPTPKNQAAANAGAHSADAAKAPAVSGEGAAATATATPGQGAATAEEVSTRAADPDPALGVPAATATPATPLQTRAAAPNAPAIGEDPATVAVRNERARVRDIQRIGQLPGIPGGTELAQRAIDTGASVDNFRAAAFERMAANELSDIPNGAHSATTGLSVGESSQSKTYRALQEGLDYRCGATATVESGSRNFAGRTLMDIAGMTLSLRGMNPMDLSRDELLKRAMATSDFPLLLANTAGKRVISSYEAVPRTFIPWARRAIANDFKTRSIVRLGSGSAPVKIGETGEIPLGKLTEGGESYRLFEFGRRLALTRQMIINDDTSTLDSIPARMGARMAELEGDVVYALVSTNPTLADGNAAFSVAHANTSAAGAPSIAAFTAIRTAMRKQTDEDGSKINVTPRHLVLPPELETAAQQFTMQVQATAGADVNPFSGSFKTVQAEPRLTAAADWYAFSDPSLTESIEYAYLAGAEAPQVELMEEFTTSGRQIRILHAFGAGWADWRGAYFSNN